MRLTETEKNAIRETIREFDDQARIVLFGSRADDTKRGGDIDLLILSEKLHESDRGAIRLRLHDRIGEQKIDILVAKDLSDPFIRVALAEGVSL